MSHSLSIKLSKRLSFGEEVANSVTHAVGAVNSVPHVGKSGNVLEVYVIRRSGGKLYAFPALVRVDQFFLCPHAITSRAICRNCRAACLCCSA